MPASTPAGNDPILTGV